jgi:hypothetical protein
MDVDIFYYYHPQAILVAEAQNVNFREIKRWSLEEGHDLKYRKFLEALKHLARH